MISSWSVIVPVKGTGDAKSRLGGTARSRRALAKAIALDTVEAVLSTPGVGMVLVVTSAAAAPDFAALGAVVLVEERAIGDPGGLNAAIEAGIRSLAAGEAAGSRGDVPVAVLLGDLPALQPHELASALTAAAGFRLAMVPDADNTGTVLITARPGVLLIPAFGPGSRAAHQALGYVELTIPASSGLRRDVDTVEQLTSVLASAPQLMGRRTAPVRSGGIGVV